MSDTLAMIVTCVFATCVGLIAAAFAKTKRKLVFVCETVSWIIFGLMPVYIWERYDLIPDYVDPFLWGMVDDLLIAALCMRAFAFAQHLKWRATTQPSKP